MTAENNESLKARISTAERMITHMRRTSARIAAVVTNTRARTSRMEHDVDNLLYASLATGPEQTGHADGQRRSCEDASHNEHGDRPAATVVARSDDGTTKALCGRCAARYAGMAAAEGKRIEIEQPAGTPRCEGPRCRGETTGEAATAVVVTEARRHGQPVCPECLDATRRLLDQHAIAHETAPITGWRKPERR